MDRRNFIGVGSALAASSIPLYSFGNGLYDRAYQSENNEVDFIFDGVKLDPQEYTKLITKLVDEGKVKPDYYSNGGVVEELENKFAAILGKESAVYMPTGTLANHIAVRKLAQDKRRIVVQEQGHLYNDSGDCAQTLSNLNLIPLGLNEVSFTLEEVKQLQDKTKSGRVETKIGVIVIESPVRRKNDRVVEYDRIKEIADYAKNNDIKMHLDGARLFVQAVHAKLDPKEFASHFDTVYTSLYKCFNAPSGAILAGSKEFTSNLYHERRMFGGGQSSVWPFAAIALYYADGFMTEYKNAWTNAEAMFSILEKQEGFEVVRFENGSHIVGLKVKTKNMPGFRDALRKQKIYLSQADGSGFLLKINPSINRINPNELANRFIEALNTTG